MAATTITLNLPEELVQDARGFDLLTDKAVAQLLQAEVDRRVMEVVNAEIRAYREEKSSRQTTRRKPSQ